jgi:hypothetical protein
MEFLQINLQYKLVVYKIILDIINQNKSEVFIVKNLNTKIKF